ncbi:MAG: hypothetical protein J5J06_05865 [Phycisphaerae bacterium]|nr:hypothetical protein [Phycisphaerae bacterium]
MSTFEHDIISMEELRAGFGKDLLAEAEVVIAVDADSREEVLHGKWDWEIAAGTAHETDLSVVRVELEAADDVDELKEMIEVAQTGGEIEGDADAIDQDDE